MRGKAIANHPDRINKTPADRDRMQARLRYVRNCNTSRSALNAFHLSQWRKIAYAV